jgi:pilus assembly protein CpaE
MLADGGRTIRVLIVDDNRTTVENVARLLNFEPDIEVVGTARNGRAGVQQTQQLKPDIVLMDINMPDMDGIEACRQILHSSPFSRVMMMSVQADMAYLKGAMKAGAREFLIKPFSYDELINTVRRVHHADPSPAELAARAATEKEPSPAAPPPKVERAVVVAVFSPKGGAGCSTVAANLAIALCGSRQADVLLIDSDLYFGDLDALLDLHPTHNMVDVLDKYDPEDRGTLQRMFAEHATGVRLLAGPGRPELAELVRPIALRSLMDTLQQAHDYLVVDVGCHLSRISEQVLDRADRIILVVTQEVTTIKSANLYLRMPGPRAYPPEKFVVVLNKYDKAWGIDPESLGSTVGRPVALVLPADENAASVAVNRGRPVLLSAPRSALVRPLLELEKLVPDQEKLTDELAELTRQRREAPPPSILEQPTRVRDGISAKLELERRGCARWLPFLAGRR